MKRADKTNLLSRLLETKLICDQTYWAREVSLDFNTAHRKRVDYMAFKPKNQSTSGIEKGIFTCYEIKSCLDDYKSGHGLNFIGEKNYIVTDMITYKKIQYEIDHNIGVYVALPVGSDSYTEWENPKELDEETRYELRCLTSSHERNRDYSINVLLFCMFRSGK